MSPPVTSGRRAAPFRAALAVVAALLAARATAQGTPGAPSRPPAAVLPSTVPGASAPASGATPGQDAILLTIFLRHDQSRPLPELNAQLDRTGFHDGFPPAGVEVVSWYVMMGIGQVVTLRVPPGKLREVNLAIENGAWGAFRTEFYPTYDYRPVWEQQRREKSQRR
jgi:hypothetical protein